MSLFAGVDLGTSGVKVVLVDADDGLHAQASRRLEVLTPHPGWSEQDPNAWWDATCACFDELRERAPSSLAAVDGIGFSGQMLAALLLDARDRPVRPAILWNDQRAVAECRRLKAVVPDIGRRTNGAPDPGITAPKLLWLRAHEPEAFAAARCLLLTKDHVRLQMTGERSTEASDAGGTMLMDCATSHWDEALVEAAAWPLDRLPPIGRAWEAAGSLRRELARRWGMGDRVLVAAGAGDNMACTLGVGGAVSGDTVITVGTSGVVCAVDHRFHPAPESAVLTGPHAAPDTFLSMGVVMSATGTLDWLLKLTGTSIETLAAEIDAFMAGGGLDHAPTFVPTLTGIRTPHNRPQATGRLIGLRPGADRAALGYALLEGVAFQLADCVAAQRTAGVPIERLSLVGGGARNPGWASLIAAALDAPVAVPEGADLAAPSGAARLARAAVDGDLAMLGRKRTIRRHVEPDADLVGRLTARRRRFDAALAEEVAAAGIEE